MIISSTTNMSGLLSHRFNPSATDDGGFNPSTADDGGVLVLPTDPIGHPFSTIICHDAADGCGADGIVRPHSVNGFESMMSFGVFSLQLPPRFTANSEGNRALFLSGKLDSGAFPRECGYLEGQDLIGKDPVVLLAYLIMGPRDWRLKARPSFNVIGKQLKSCINGIVLGNVEESLRWSE